MSLNHNVYCTWKTRDVAIQLQQNHRFLSSWWNRPEKMTTANTFQQVFFFQFHTFWCSYYNSSDWRTCWGWCTCARRGIPQRTESRWTLAACSPAFQPCATSHHTHWHQHHHHHHHHHHWRLQWSSCNMDDCSIRDHEIKFHWSHCDVWAHSFLWQILRNSAVQFAKFRGLPWKIIRILWHTMAFHLTTRNVGQCPTWWSPCRTQVAPSVQRRKVWLTPTTRCCAVTLPRRKTRWNL